MVACGEDGVEDSGAAVLVLVTGLGTDVCVGGGGGSGPAWSIWGVGKKGGRVGSSVEVIARPGS